MLFRSESSIYPPAPSRHGKKSIGKNKIGVDEIRQYRELIRMNIDYETLLAENPYEQDLIDGYVELIVEACCSKKNYIRVNQEDMPRDVVKNRLLKLDKEHISYVMECLRNNTTHVGNIRAYTLSALYNAPVTIDQHYISLVSHDMSQGAI